MRELYARLDDQNLSLCLFKVTEFFMSRKEINPDHLDFFETCVKDVIKIAVQRKFAVGVEALRNIFSTDAEFYKHARLDSEMRFPMGLRHPIKNYYP